MKKFALRLPTLTPRNPLAALARKRTAGAHGSGKRRQAAENKDLVQRLREAGM